jgi:hypothetical protein
VAGSSVVAWALILSVGRSIVTRGLDGIMIFRLTHKASTKLRIHCEAIGQGQASMLEWYCNLVIVQRRHFFLFTQATTLFSFWAPAAGWSRAELGSRFRRHATDTLRDYGFTDGDVARIIDSEPDTFSKTVDRGVTGSMVDYAHMLQHSADYEGGLDRLSSRDMNDLANECPMSKIGMKLPAEYLRQVLQAKGAA